MEINERGTAIDESFLVVVDGPPGSGKSSVVRFLIQHGYRAREGGVPTEIVHGLVPAESKSAKYLEFYVILDAPAEVCLERLQRAWHSDEDLPSVDTLDNLVKAYRRAAEVLPPEAVFMIDATRESKQVESDAYRMATMAKLRAKVRVRGGRA